MRLAQAPMSSNPLYDSATSDGSTERPPSVVGRYVASLPEPPAYYDADVNMTDEDTYSVPESPAYLDPGGMPARDHAYDTIQQDSVL